MRLTQKRETDKRQAGFAMIFAMLLLTLMTSMGILISEMSMMEVEIGGIDRCAEIARMRANSCLQLFTEAAKGELLPSLVVTNLSNSENSGDAGNVTVECLVPALNVAPDGAQRLGEGGMNIGKIAPTGYSLDYYYIILLSKAYGFGGEGCGDDLVVDSSNDPFGVLTGKQTATGIIHEQEVALSYGPCSKDSPCGF